MDSINQDSANPNENKRKWIIGAVAIVIIAVIAWFAFKPANTEAIKIGASLPLSGEVASYGEMVRAGIELAAREINEAGGVNGRMIELVFEDDRCDSSGASAINKLVNIDKVDAIVGPLCSASTGPGAPIAERGRVPMIMFASAPGLTEIGDYIFRTYPSDSFQGKFAAEYAYNVLGKRSVAVIYINNEWGQGLNDVFTRTFTALGGTIVHSESVLQDTTDLRTILARVRGTNPDMIYYPVYSAQAVSGLRQMRELGINVQVMSGDIFDVPEIVGAPEAEGALFTFGQMNNPEDFQAKVRSATGVESVAFTAVSYDSVKILASIMEDVGTNKSRIRDRLQSLSYTQGISLPLIEFDNTGDLSTAQVEMRVIRNGRTQSHTP